MGTNCRMCGAGAVRGIGAVDGFEYAECDRCGLAFTPDVDERTRESLYESRSAAPTAEAPDDGWARADFLDPAWARLRHRPLQVLDFGAGDSALPDALRRRGHRVLAADLRPPARPHADRLTGDLLELGLPESRFDLSYSFQVFEHLLRPAPILDELIRLTRPGGLVAIHTDMETPERHRRGFADWWYVMPPRHCTLFRNRTFDSYLEGTRHRVVERSPKFIVIRVDAAGPRRRT